MKVALYSAARTGFLDHGEFINHWFHMSFYDSVDFEEGDKKREKTMSKMGKKRLAQ